jgi:protein O-mannosyl-transferase
LPLKTPDRERSIDPGAIVVALAAAVAFLPSLSGRFVWDDFDYVRNNPILLAHGLTAIERMFRLFVVGNYHPLTMASLALDNLLFGPNPPIFHLTNVLLHAANAVLVGRLFFALGIRRDAAWAGALLWAVHPLRVEPVAWISGRKDLLYVFFFLSALLTYLRHAKANAGVGRDYAWAFGFFCCSLLSKGAAVAFVPVMVLADGFVGRRPSTRSVAEKVPFLAVAVVIGVVAIAAQRTAGALPSTPVYGIGGRLAVACYGLVFYLVKTLAPWGLSAFYPYPSPSAGLPAVAWAAVIVVVAAGLLVWWLRRFRTLVFAACVYLATLALVLQVVPVGGAIAADRYAYLPGVAVSLVIAAALGARPFRRSFAVVVVAAALLLAGGSWARCAVWRDGASLWNDVLAKYPDVPLAHQNRGVDRAASGDQRGAIVDYDAAIAESPGFADAWANRGASKADLGDLDGAIADLSEAIRIDPARASYRFNLGLVLGDRGRWDEALASLGEAIRLQPDFAAAYLNRGLALRQIGRAAEGAADLQRAEELGYPVRRKQE